MQVSQLI